MIENGVPRTISRIDRDATSVTITVEKQAGSGDGFPWTENRLEVFIRNILEQNDVGFPLTGKELQDYLKDYQDTDVMAKELEGELDE